MCIGYWGVVCRSRDWEDDTGGRVKANTEVIAECEAARGCLAYFCPYRDRVLTERKTDFSLV